MINAGETKTYDDYKICPKCGQKILLGNAFCTKCGSKIDENNLVEIQHNEIIVENSIEQLQLPDKSDGIYNSTKDKSKLKIVIIVIIVLLACSIAGNIYEYITIQNQNAALEISESELRSSKTRITALQNEVDRYQPKAEYYDDICSFLSSSDAGYASGNFKCSDKIVYLKSGGNSKNVTLTTGYTGTYSWYYSGDSATGDFKYNSWQGNTTTFIFTSSLFRNGITTFTFTNSVNSQKFRVLVIVE